MTDIAKTDITVTLAPGDSYNPPGMPLVSFPSLAFGNGALTYPTHGIPLPDMGKLGAFKKAIKRILITPAPGDGYIYKYDKNYNTIRIYQAGAIGSITLSANSAGTPTGNVADATLTIAAPTANLHDGTVAANTVSNLAVDVAAPTGNLANKVVTMEALANHTHSVTGGTGVAAQLVELGSVAVAATVLDLMVVGE
jgi:hypothetical protein